MNVQRSIMIDSELWIKFKIYCVTNKKNMSQVVSGLIEDHMREVGLGG